eukprot:6222898-Amphidinium_carterae.1
MVATAFPGWGPHHLYYFFSRFTRNDRNAATRYSGGQLKQVLSIEYGKKITRCRKKKRLSNEARIEIHKTYPNPQNPK